MAQVYREGDRPVPGYQLGRFIGRGPLGTVWQATAPGGTPVALKIIDLAGRQGIREFRAVRRVRNLSHAYLLPIQGFWLKDDLGTVLDGLMPEDADSTTFLRSRASELILALGLGDRSLADRLKECQAAGQPGLRAEELLDYLEEAAKAIDYLNQPIHDQGGGKKGPMPHGALKPSNLLIVGTAVQVSDFGLAREMGASRPGSLTEALVYGAPELLEDAPGPASDQYALAVTYAQLRTGKLPFPTSNPAALMRAQQGEKPLLDGLTADEQPLVRKALSANPAKRFPNCVEFIRALRRAFQQMTPAAKPPPTGRKAPPPAAGRELVPGYRLVRLLGQGTFGQVWEATGPGGVTLALKIIENLHESASQQEYRALEVIRGVEHKYLMEITAYWILDAYGQVIPDELRDRPGAPAPATLVIASRLARGHLGQRLKDCLAQTGQGIPLRELLRYMDQAARAIDFMNKPQHLLDGKPIAIQHRDIKPENILLSANNDVKIADFGLAKVVEGISSIIHTKSMGLTPYYAPPELFRNEVTRWSDQYSLAVTYAQLRAGSLPFPAVRSLTEIMRIHLEGRLDLSRLPAPEAEVIRKATAVKAEERYPTCRDMVKALVAACADELAALPPTGSFKPVSFDEPASDLAPPPPAAADLPPPVPVDQLNLDTLPAARLGRATPAGGTAVPTEVPDEADHPTGEGLLGKMKNWFWGKKGPGP